MQSSTYAASLTRLVVPKLQVGRFSCFYSVSRTGLLQGLRLCQQAGGTRSEVHGREKRGHSTGGTGRPFSQTHPRAFTAIQLQLHGRHAGHLRRG